MDAISASLSGVNTAIDRFERASNDIVRSASGASDASLVDAVVETVQAEAQLRANVSVMGVANEMYATLLDIKA
ncbi:MAG: hypothetical protein R3C52_14600 [Hyphomonadaceae bacterium]